MTQIIQYPQIEKVKITKKTTDNKTIVVELLTRKFLEETYVDLNLGLDELLSVYNITYKSFYKAYRHWFTREERKKIGGGKISRSQKTNNSNHKNTGIPRKLITEETLKELLDKKYSLEKMSRVLKLAPQTVTRSLRYHKLEDQLIRSGINYEAYLFTQKIDKMFSTNITAGIEEIGRDPYAEKVNNALTDLVTVLTEISSIEQEIKKLKRSFLWKINKETSHKDGLYNFPVSLVNKKVFSIIKELGIKAACEFKIEDKFFDFIIVNTKYLIEIDPEYTHSSKKALKNDSYKDALAEKHGYTLLRIKLKDDEGVTIIKAKLTECFYNLGLLK